VDTFKGLLVSFVLEGFYDSFLKTSPLVLEFRVLWPFWLSGAISERKLPADSGHRLAKHKGDKVNEDRGKGERDLSEYLPGYDIR
jgi:hypothetical protein